MRNISHPVFPSLPRRPSPLLSPSTWKRMFKGRIPGQVVVQYTERCNAQCAQCGMRAGNVFQRSTMGKDDTKRLIDALAERGVQAISFTGGEPLLCLDEIVEHISYAHRAGIHYIRTGTNGFMFRGAERAGFHEKITRIAEKLAATPLNTFWISVDSASDVIHEKNRGLPGVMQGIQKGLPIFHEHGLFPSANLGVNRYTGGNGANTLPRPADPDFSEERFYAKARNAFTIFYDKVAQLGFTIVNACYPMSLDSDEANQEAVYAATAEDDFIRFNKQEKIQLFKALYDVIPNYRDKLRIFTPRSSLLALIRQYSGESFEAAPCRGGIDFFFVDSKDMNTYPCGYRGSENLGKFWELDMNALDTTQTCTRCDWECFRDPSEMLTPLVGMLQHPLKMGKRLLSDREMSRAWLGDLRYYHACDYFNARRPMDGKKLARFA